MDLVDLNKIIIASIQMDIGRDPCGSRGSKSRKSEWICNNYCRDPCGSRGSKSAQSAVGVLKLSVEILVDLVDLNLCGCDRVD